MGLVCVIAMSAQTELFIFNTDKTVLGLPVSTIDSILFTNESVMSIYKTDKSQKFVSLSGIDSVSLGEVVSDTVTITYNGTTAIVDNPMARQGVAVSVSGADVVVNSTVLDNKVNYLLKGTATDGSFKIYSTYRLDLILNGVSLMNSDGPAINIQTKKRCEITLDAGTTNTLTDGTSYAKSTEDQKGTFFSEGQLIFKGLGTLTVNGNAKNGIVADDFIEVNGGTLNLNVTPAGAKGLKCSGTLTLNAGILNVTMSGAVSLEASGLGFDPSYSTGVKGDSSVNLNGTSIKVTGTGAGSKGISAGGALTMNAGTVNVTCSGAGATYKNAAGVTDSYSSSCITSDGVMQLLGGSLTTLTGTAATGGKGISSDAAITIGSTTTTPVLNIKTTGARFLVSGTDYCHPKTLVSPAAIVINSGTNTFTTTDDGIHSDLSVTINGGNNTVTASSSTQGVGEGVEGPSITFNGGTTNITASNDGINGTFGTVVNGTESNDGSIINFKGGIVIVAGSDAVDGNGNISMTGGTVIVNGPQTGVEEGFDFNGTFTVNGGLLISAGSNSNMTKAMSTTSTQPCMYLKSSAVIASSSILHIENASGTEMLTFKPKNGGYYFHVSTPSLVKGSQYKIYSGGTYSGGSFVGGTTGNGLYTGGTYSTTGATLKSTTTLSTTSTVNTISF